VSVIKQQISNLVQKSAEMMDLPIKDIDWVLELPADPSHGDYASNLALKLAGKVSAFKNPLQLAEALVEKIESEKAKSEQLNKYLNQVSVAKPGFINFKLSDAFYTHKIALWLQSSAMPVDQIKNGKKVVVEYTDANPFKSFTLGIFTAMPWGKRLLV